MEPSFLLFSQRARKPPLLMAVVRSPLLVCSIKTISDAALRPTAVRALSLTASATVWTHASFSTHLIGTLGHSACVVRSFQRGSTQTPKQSLSFRSVAVPAVLENAHTPTLLRVAKQTRPHILNNWERVDRQSRQYHSLSDASSHRHDRGGREGERERIEGRRECLPLSRVGP